jgi:hypothetical protein
MKKALVCIIAAGMPLLICHLTVAAEPSLFSFQLSKVRNIRGLKIPLGMQANMKPTVSVYFGEISVESKRAGFLRIGPIPQPVVSGLRVDILEHEGGAGWAADFAKFATGEAALERANIRGIEFHAINKDSVSVRAEDARFVARSRTLRLRGVQVHAEGRDIPLFAAAEVHLDGAKAGQIEWNDGERVRSILLSGAPSVSGAADPAVIR